MRNENNLYTSIPSRVLPLFVSLLLLFSCNTTKYLQPDEAFLKKNSVHIESEQKIKKKKKLAADLFSIIKQKPNTNFLLINRRWFYYNSKKKQKKKKSSRRIVAELPSIYQQALAEESAKSMEFFLAKRGYYNAEVDFETKIKEKQAFVTYIVKPKALFTVDTIEFVSKDRNIQKILNDIHAKTVFKKGEPVSNQLYEKEKKRITQHLRNSGYRDFYVNYIDKIVSTTDSARIKELQLSLNVFPFNDTTDHKTYRIGEIYVYPFYNPQHPPETMRDTLVNDIHFMLSDNSRYKVRSDVIAQRIFLKKGELYSQNNYNKTIQNLGELGIFKFANINDKITSDTSSLIDFLIYLPANQRRSIGGNLEYKNTSFSETSITDDNFNGGEISLSYQDKNALGGSELFNANLRFGGQFGNNQQGSFLNSYDINPQFDLSIPKFRDLFGFVRILNGIGLFSNAFYNSLLENANTQLSLGLNWTERKDFWGYFSSDISLGYEIQNNPNRRYFVKQFGINIFDPKVDTVRGREIFENNPFLERSFNNSQLFTGLIIKDFGFSFSGRNSIKNSSWRLFFNSEISGVEALLVKSIANEFRAEKKDTFQLLGLDFAHFGRIDIDGRYYKYLSPEKSLAFRLNTGIAFPFGGSQDVPYVKQFLAGGPNSLRAWRIRELGPGSYRDPSTFPEYSENRQPFYQTGDFKFIFNAEYRFLFFKFFGFDWEGALFLDGGNVWTLKADPDRPGSELTTQFWRQIALGTGAGIRINFDYFILRFDFGYKLRNPYPNPEGSYWATQEFKEFGFRGINSNLAVGYAF